MRTVSVGYHLPGLADSQFARLAAVCDTDPIKVAAQAQQHKVPGFTDIRALLEDVRPDFAIVAVPRHVGQKVIETCAAAGVHVMKEKPFATGPAEAAELVALCDKSGIELMVTVQRRFHPVYTAAVQLLEQIGRPYLVEGRYTFHCADPAAGWRGRASLAGGGALMDMGCHLIDLLIWYLGLPDRSWPTRPRPPVPKPTTTPRTPHWSTSPTTPASTALCSSPAPPGRRPNS
ncbi:Gfo/Idh/MocA family oxidoreductase [Streptomyces sp. NPDC096095]|uniref:Gfo/Idh/MocA family protein n=1 Tax=Streptomyces sp. NPDC096095 TaxID=3155545 RepID=UPI003323A3F4